MNIDEIFQKSSSGSIKKISRRQLERGYNKSDSANQLPDESLQDGRPSKIIKGELSKQDEDEDEDEDEDDRFFMDGLSKKEKNIFDWVDKVAQIDKTGADSAKKSILRLEKAISKNTELRLRYPNQPEKFIESEADLDEAILDLQQFSMQPSEAFPILFELGSLESIVNLLTHENKDIVIDIIQVIAEWTEEDQASGVEKSDFDDVETLKSLIKELRNLSFFELLGATLASFTESTSSENMEAERDGVNKVLSIVENICSIDGDLAFEVSMDMKLLPYLFVRVQNPYLTPEEAKISKIDNNQQYAGEILSILAQSSPKICTLVAQPISPSIRLSGIEILLGCIAKYRKRDPVDDTEYEYLENLFNVIISSIVADPNSKQVFFDAEGVELICLILKEANYANILSLKLLDFLLTPPDPKVDSEIGHKAASAFLDCGGYQSLSRSLMKRHSRKFSKHYKSYSSHQEQYRVVNILSWLFRFTRANTKHRWLLLSKFVSHKNADPKVKLACQSRLDRLVELHLYYSECVNQDEYDENVQLSVEDPELGLKMVDLTISIIALNDSMARSHLSKSIELKQDSLQSVQKNALDYVFELFLDSENSEDPRNSESPENLGNPRFSELSFDQAYKKLNTDLKEIYLAAKSL